MKMMKLLFVLISLFLVTSIVESVGISPPQLRVVDAPLGSLTKIASLSVVNTDDEPSFVLLQIGCLNAKRPHKLRVICNGCGREVGIQRGDLIYPAKIIQLKDQETHLDETTGLTQILGMNATVEYKSGVEEEVFIPFILNQTHNVVGDHMLVTNGEYTLNVPNTNISIVRQGNYMFKQIDKKEALSNKRYCPFCGASEKHMIFYDFLPQVVMENISLICEKYPLEQIDATTYKTIEKVDSKAGILADIYLNIPNKKIYCGKYWEARVMGMTVSNMSELRGFIIYGAEAKLLIDTPALPEVITVEKEDITPFIVIIASIGGVCIVLVLLLMPKKKGKVKTISKHKKVDEPVNLKEATKGRRLL